MSIAYLVKKHLKIFQIFMLQNTSVAKECCFLFYLESAAQWLLTLKAVKRLLRIISASFFEDELILKTAKNELCITFQNMLE